MSLFLVLLCLPLLLLLLHLMVLWLMMMVVVINHNKYHHCSILRRVTSHITMMYSFCYWYYFLHILTGTNRKGDSESNCNSRECEFNPSLVPYLYEDWSWINDLLFSSFCLFSKGCYNQMYVQEVLINCLVKK